MAEVGKQNSLKVLKELDFGMYLDGADLGEILLPIRYVPKDAKIGDTLDVFIYLDSEDRIIATTEKPLASVGDFALLQVVQVNSTGAFLDWGLMKDLFLPFSEQRLKVEEGDWSMVHVYIDQHTNRIVASAKVEDFLDKTPHEFKVGDEVDAVLYTKTDLGFKAIINNAYTGMVYNKDVFRKQERGKQIKAYIKQVREDKKIDLILDKPGREKVDEISTQILGKLREHGGFIPLMDKSPADDVYKMFGISKKTFKQAIGGLYKARLITLEENGIKLIVGNEQVH
jgi:predicted RNA-binding protein (virulence factor B family)